MNSQNFKRKFLGYVLGFTFLLSLTISSSSCLSLANFEDATVLDQGNTEIGGHVGYFDNPSNGQWAADEVFEAGIYGRAGLGYNLEMSVRFNTQFAGTLGLKYQFLNRKNGMLLGATGLTLGGILMHNDAGFPGAWGQVPLILSVKPSSNFTWYGSYNYLFFTATSNYNLRFGYFCSGVKVGSRYGLMLETNFIPRWSDRNAVLGSLQPGFAGHQQIHGGIFIKF